MQVQELCRKEVINLYNGIFLGRICDVEIDTQSAAVTHLIIAGRLRFLGLLGREEDIRIPWEDVDVIGDDGILVRYRPPHRRAPRGFLRQGRF